MSKNKGLYGAKKYHVPSSEKTEDALVALIASTKRINRKLSLLEIADKLEIAQQGLGSLHEVAEKIGLSYEMLREFVSIKKLPPKVKRLISERRIESIDVAFHLSKLKEPDQETLAEAYVKDGLTSESIRAIVILKRNSPNVPISTVIKRVIGSQDIKQYVVLFNLAKEEIDRKKILLRFSSLLGKENIISFSVERNVGTLKINRKGKNVLQKIARDSSLSKRELIEKVLTGELG